MKTRAMVCNLKRCSVQASALRSESPWATSLARTTTAMMARGSVHLKATRTAKSTVLNSKHYLETNKAGWMATLSKSDPHTWTRGTRLLHPIRCHREEASCRTPRPPLGIPRPHNSTALRQSRSCTTRTAPRCHRRSAPRNIQEEDTRQNSSLPMCSARTVAPGPPRRPAPQVRSPRSSTQFLRTFRSSSTFPAEAKARASV